MEDIERRLVAVEHKLSDGNVFLRTDLFHAMLATITKDISNVREDVADTSAKFEKMDRTLDNLWRLLTVEFLGFIFGAAALIIMAVSRG